MQSRLLLPLGLLASALPALAQQDASHGISRVESVRNAGIYHVSTGTWTRTTASTAALGPDVIYRNDVPSGYTATFFDQAEVVDEGRIPALGSHPMADRTEYRVNGFNFEYCTDSNPGSTEITFRFYESYLACDSIAAPLACQEESGVVALTGLPGGQGSVACWTLTIDLQDQGFDLEGDGGACAPGFQMDLAADSFGWSAQFVNGAGTQSGLTLAGDPDYTPDAFTALLHGGGGTYYFPLTTCGATGLDTQDLFRVEAGGTLLEGCYFFGGYAAGPSCGQVATPFASFNFTLYANGGEGCAGPFCETCTANVNSTGGIVRLGGSFSGPGVAHLEAFGGPNGAMGYFLAAQEQVLPATNGLCLSGPIGRYAPNTASVTGNSALNSLGAFDPSGVFVNMAGTSSTGTGYDVPASLPPRLGGSVLSGSKVYFQLWYRDAQSTAFSSALEVDF